MSSNFRNTNKDGRRYELCPNQTQKETNYANVVDSHVFQPTLRAKCREADIYHSVTQLASVAIEQAIFSCTSKAKVTKVETFERSTSEVSVFNFSLILMLLRAQYRSIRLDYNRPLFGK